MINFKINTEAKLWDCETPMQDGSFDIQSYPREHQAFAVSDDSFQITNLDKKERLYFGDIENYTIEGVSYTDVHLFVDALNNVIYQGVSSSAGTNNSSNSDSTEIIGCIKTRVSAINLNHKTPTSVDGVELYGLVGEFYIYPNTNKTETVIKQELYDLALINGYPTLDFNNLHVKKDTNLGYGLYIASDNKDFLNALVSGTSNVFTGFLDYANGYDAWNNFRSNSAGGAGSLKKVIKNGVEKMVFYLNGTEIINQADVISFIPGPCKGNTINIDLSGIESLLTTISTDIKSLPQELKDQTIDIVNSINSLKDTVVLGNTNTINAINNIVLKIDGLLKVLQKIEDNTDGIETRLTVIKNTLIDILSELQKVKLETSNLICAKNKTLILETYSDGTVKAFGNKIVDGKKVEVPLPKNFKNGPCCCKSKHYVEQLACVDDEVLEVLVEWNGLTPIRAVTATLPQIEVDVINLIADCADCCKKPVFEKDNTVYDQNDEITITGDNINEDTEVIMFVRYGYDVGSTINLTDIQFIAPNTIVINKTKDKGGKVQLKNGKCLSDSFIEIVVN